MIERLKIFGKDIPTPKEDTIGLGEYTDAELIAELRNRGFIVKE